MSEKEYRLDTADIPLNTRVLAVMLGVQRAGVTLGLRNLETAWCDQGHPIQTVRCWSLATLQRSLGSLHLLSARFWPISASGRSSSRRRSPSRAPPFRSSRAQWAIRWRQVSCVFFDFIRSAG